MSKNKNDVVFFSQKTSYQIGKTTYKIASHFNENAPPLIEKMKNLLKVDLHLSGFTAGLSGSNMV